MEMGVYGAITGFNTSGISYTVCINLSQIELKLDSVEKYFYKGF